VRHDQPSPVAANPPEPTSDGVVFQPVAHFGREITTPPCKSACAVALVDEIPHVQPDLLWSQVQQLHTTVSQMVGKGASLLWTSSCCGARRRWLLSSGSKSCMNKDEGSRRCRRRSLQRRS
jgi:hypothetical protein